MFHRLGLQNHIISGIYWDNGKEHGNYYLIYWGFGGIMEKKMETTIYYVGVIIFGREGSQS